MIGAYGESMGGTLSRTGEYLRQAGFSQDDQASYPDGDTVFLAVSSGMSVFVASGHCKGFAQRFGGSGPYRSMPIARRSHGSCLQVPHARDGRVHQGRALRH